MRWPEIFFKAKPAPARAGDPAKTAAPPTTGSEPGGVPTPVPAPAPPATAAESGPVKGPTGTTRLPITQVKLPPAPVHPGAGDDEVIREMEEADTLRTMTRSGGVRLVKLNFAAPIPPGAQVSSDPDGEGSRGPAASAATPDLAIPREPAADGASGHPAGVTIFRRKTKIADVARIVLPPRRDEMGPPASKSSSEAEPAGMTPADARATQHSSVADLAPPIAAPGADSPKREAVPFAPAPEKVSDPAATSVPPMESKPADGRSAMAVGQNSGPLREENPASAAAARREPIKPEPATAVSPAPEMAAPAPRPTTALAETREKREFVLSNGERILGHILSETPDAIYVEHGTLGVLTIPRAQIAQHPIEVILVNGDRIVGDVIAETSDALFVRHASLGILTIPHKQRSARVVEAILKDGDRILGEVLGETESVTVIRSATLGTVSVPHHRVAMLNKRAEEIQMKSLPPTAPQVEDKPSA
jgi:RNase P/RNase MRP subunit p29